MTVIILDQQNFLRYVTILGGKQENFFIRHNKFDFSTFKI